MHFISLTLPAFEEDDLATISYPLPTSRLKPIDWPRLQSENPSARTAFSLLHQTFADPAAYPLFRSPCLLPGCERIRLEWSIGTSAGWAKFLVPKTPDPLGPVWREYTLLTVSGQSSAEDAEALHGLRSMFNVDPHTHRPLALTARERDLPPSAEYQRLHDALPATAAAILASLHRA
jgi:hypothetical protein